MWQVVTQRNPIATLQLYSEAVDSIQLSARDATGHSKADPRRQTGGIDTRSMSTPCYLLTLAFYHCALATKKTGVAYDACDTTDTDGGGWNGGGQGAAAVDGISVRNCYKCDHDDYFFKFIKAVVSIAI